MLSNGLTCGVDFPFLNLLILYIRRFSFSFFSKTKYTIKTNVESLKTFGVTIVIFEKLGTCFNK